MKSRLTKKQMMIQDLLYVYMQTLNGSENNTKKRNDQIKILSNLSIESLKARHQSIFQ